eukprot:UN2406
MLSGDGWHSHFAYRVFTSTELHPCWCSLDYMSTVQNGVDPHACARDLPRRPVAANQPTVQNRRAATRSRRTLEGRVPVYSGLTESHHHMDFT